MGVVPSRKAKHKRKFPANEPCRLCGAAEKYKPHAAYCNSCRLQLDREQNVARYALIKDHPAFKAERSRKWKAAYPTNKAKIAAYNKAAHTKMRLEILARYGGQCACCGESEPTFLAIDHVHNDGAQHRRKLGIKGGMALYRWIRDNSYPDTLQVLCHNCNFAKVTNPVCPHRKSGQFGAE